MKMDNKKEFPKRKDIRLKNYDYSSPGAYFVTICTENRKNYFWNGSIDPQIFHWRSVVSSPHKNFMFVETIIEYIKTIKISTLDRDVLV